MAAPLIETRPGGVWRRRVLMAGRFEPGGAGRHDDWHAYLGTVLAFAYQPDAVEAIERLHLPLGEDDVRHPLLYFHEGIRRVVAKTDVF